MGHRSTNRPLPVIDDYEATMRMESIVQVTTQTTDRLQKFLKPIIIAFMAISFRLRCSIERTTLGQRWADLCYESYLKSAGFKPRQK